MCAFCVNKHKMYKYFLALNRSFIQIQQIIVIIKKHKNVISVYLIFLGEMSIEELVKRYEGAYNSDFEMPDVESGDTTEDTEEYGSDNGNGLINDLILNISTSVLVCMLICISNTKKLSFR